MRIGIISSNIYLPGGTTRSNINLIHELVADENNQVIVFNVINKQKDRAREIMYEEKFDSSRVIFKTIADMLEEKNIELYIITREDYFGVSRVIKTVAPDSRVVGEIHAPLAFLTSKSDELYPETIDCYRVGSETIKRAFIEKYHLSNVLAFNVSLRHVLSNFETANIEVSHTILSYSRFDERQKNISYLIKLAQYLPQQKIAINGYGPDDKLYEKMIANAPVENITFNQTLPENYVYFSSAHYETLGYSIMEAIAQGKKVILNKGKDHEVFNIYQGFKGVLWLTHTPKIDASNITAFMGTCLTAEEFQENKNWLYQQFVVTGYGKQLIEAYQTYPISSQTLKLNKKEIKKILNSLNEHLIKKIMKKLKR